MFLLVLWIQHGHILKFFWLKKNYFCPFPAAACWSGKFQFVKIGLQEIDRKCFQSIKKLSAQAQNLQQELCKLPGPGSEWRMLPGPGSFQRWANNLIFKYIRIVRTKYIWKPNYSVLFKNRIIFVFVFGFNFQTECIRIRIRFLFLDRIHSYSYSVFIF